MTLLSQAAQFSSDGTASGGSGTSRWSAPARRPDLLTVKAANALPAAPHWCCTT